MKAKGYLTPVIDRLLNSYTKQVDIALQLPIDLIKLSESKSDLLENRYLICRMLVFSSLQKEVAQTIANNIARNLQSQYKSIGNGDDFSLDLRIQSWILLKKLIEKKLIERSYIKSLIYVIGPLEMDPFILSIMEKLM